MKCTRLLALTAVTASLLSVSAFAADKEDDSKDVALKDLPAAVRATAEAQVPGGRLTEAERETEDGKTLYSIDAVTSAGEKLEIEVSTDGKLIKVEKDDDDEDDSKDVALKDLPAAVRATAEAQVPGGKLTEAELETEDGTTLYSIDAVKAGEKLEIEVSADGRLVSVEKEVALADLPAEVRATAEAQIPGGKLTEAELETEDGTTLYSIDAVTADGRKLEIEVSTDGKLTKVEKDDDDDGHPAKSGKRD